MSAHADGLVLLDKPPGWTSHDAVARLRRLAGTRKVGHAGTLDPMATGLLVLGVNRATRLLTYLVGADKEYTATIRLGQDTITDDAEGEITTARGASTASESRLGEQMTALTGSIEQVPSTVSAIKVDGERAYAKARAGEQVELKARPVQVEVFEVTGPARSGRADDETPVLDVDVRVVCSSGTYVRALARDLGAALGTGGHLIALRRTRVGAFSIGDAQDLGELSDGTQQLRIQGITPVCTALFEVLALTEPQARALRYGQPIEASGPPPSSTDRDADPVAAAHPDGHVIALLQRRADRWRPVLVFDPA